MNKDKLIDAVGEIDEKIISDVAITRKMKKAKKNIWVRITAVAACMCLLVTGMFSVFHKNSRENPFAAFAIENAVYPERAKYPTNINDFNYEIFDKQYSNWSNEKRNNLSLIKGYERSLDSYINNSLSQFMSGVDDENKVFSPLNTYIALSVLAETTDGESRSQILNLLGCEDIEEVRERISAIWNSVFCDDGTSQCIPANSMWLDRSLKYNRETIKTICDKYFSSSFSGEMGSEKYDKALQKWLSEQTGGLLDDYASNEKFSSETIFAIASTLLFTAQWDEKFYEGENTKDIFHGAQGDTNAEFMHSSDSMSYYYSDNFSAIQKQFSQNNGSMWLIRPDDDKSVNQLLSDKALLNLISGEKMPDSTYINVNLSLPKFDISSNIDLCDGLNKLGVSDIFSGEKSDFSPLINSQGAYVGQFSHSARITVDEEGCKAAAFSVLETNGDALPPEEEVDFVLDNPFIVVIKSANKLPLFVGVVNNIQ